MSASLLVGVPVGAHHSFSMFDQSKSLTLRGTVVEYKWSNPHTHIIVSVPSRPKEPDLAGTWDIEGASVAIMTRQGWNKGTFKAGDNIVLVTHPLRNGGKGGSLMYAFDKGGKRLYHDTERPGR